MAERLASKQGELSAIFVKRQEITNRQNEQVAPGSQAGAGSNEGRRQPQPEHHGARGIDEEPAPALPFSK